ncbi:MAG: hypothetical protein M3S32_04520 [Acidobacteriota bacterium]|nr:hypothetical protein [Acidobacteriota bacterium]
MHPYAQTNIQLFNQLHRQGYSSADLKSVVSAYELMTLLMTGRFRASGKTFVAHLVGTASILASLEAPSALVVAGLLHAVYTAGDFGDDRSGSSEARRERVRSVVGERAEEYISRYDGLLWTDQTIRGVSENLDSMASIERDVVLMRLANELEEFLDLGLHYSGEQRRLKTSGSDRCDLMVGMAQKLGVPRLSEELARTIDESASATLPAEVVSTRNASFLLPPLSYQRLKNSLVDRLAARQGAMRDRPDEP